MRGSILALLCLTSAVAAGKDWALLFTGAHGYYNYSTHSNLCHAYQVLHNAGIPDERIVVIMYDDVADNPDNPFPGLLFNNYSKVDVYKGTPIDYSGDDIDAELILAVLSGDKETVKSLTGRVGKVIESGPEDNIFVAVSDHGAPGILMMPNGKNMTSRQLLSTIQDMHDKKRYAKFVFYLESCESGSMFEDLPKDINAFALTASDGAHNAAMNYCDFEFMMTCLGGQFSTAWTESSERVDLSTFTVENSVKAVIKGVNFSHPQTYGDMSIKQMPLAKFFGGESKFSQISVRSAAAPPRVVPNNDTAPFHLMTLTLLQRKAARNPLDVSVRRELERVKVMISGVDQFFSAAASRVYPQASGELLARITVSPAERIRNWDCYEAAIAAATSSCPGLLLHHEIEAYTMSKYSAFVNLCNRETAVKVTRAVQDAAVVSSICQWA